MVRRYTAVAAIVALFTLSIGSLLAAPSLKRSVPWHRQITTQHAAHRVALVTPSQLPAASIPPGSDLNHTAVDSQAGAAAGASAAGTLAKGISAPQRQGWIAEKITKFQNWSGDRIGDVAEMVSAVWHSDGSKKKHSKKSSKVDATALVHRTVGGIPDPPPPPTKKPQSKKKKGSGAVIGAGQGGTGGTPPGDPPGQGGAVTSVVAGNAGGSSGSGSASGGTPAGGTSGSSGGSSGSGSGPVATPAGGTPGGSGGSSGSGSGSGSTPASGTSSGSGGSSGSGSGSGGGTTAGLMQPVQKIALFDMANSQTPSYIWSDDWIATHGMMVTIYHDDASGQVADMFKRVKSIHALNPNFKFLLYTLMQVYRGWGDSTIEAHESWFLHNPDGSTNPADRVWRWESGTRTYMMDIRNPGYQDYVMSIFIDMVAKNGLDGLYADGPHYNFDLPQNMGWEHGPTNDQTDNWWKWETTLWYPKLKAKLDAAASGKWIITNTSAWGGPATGGGWDDSAILPYVTGTFIEFWCGFTLSGGTGYDWWWTRANVIQRNTSKGKVTVLDATNFAPSQDALYFTYLLDADGTYVYFSNGSWAQGAHDNEQPKPVGIPMGPATQNPDGTWTRTFAPDANGHFVEFTVNPSENGHGSLTPWGFTATWH